MTDSKRKAARKIATIGDRVIYAYDGQRRLALVLWVDQHGDSPARYRLIAWSDVDGSQEFIPGADPDFCERVGQ